MVQCKSLGTEVHSPMADARIVGHIVTLTRFGAEQNYLTKGRLTKGRLTKGRLTKGRLTMG